MGRNDEIYLLEKLLECDRLKVLKFHTSLPDGHNSPLLKLMAGHPALQLIK
jgi:hypothetical protein